MKTMRIPPATADQFRGARLRLGCSQRKLAETLDMSLTSIQGMEHGRQEVSTRTWLAMLYLLNLRPPGWVGLLEPGPREGETKGDRSRGPARPPPDRDR